MACDICGETGTYLVYINAGYKTDDIQQICSGCEKKVSDQLWKIREVTKRLDENWLKTFMRHMRAKFKS